MKKRSIALLMACMMVFGAAVGGTMAWLTDKSGSVVNTFTVGDINIQLNESGLNKDNIREYDFVPGDILPKDPVVKVEAGSEACYVFVKVEELNNNRMDLKGDIIQWEVDEDVWFPYQPAVSKANTTYYYRVVDATTASAGGEWYILEGKHEDDCVKENCTCEFGKGYVTVNENVTKEMVSALLDRKPQLKFTAAAVQSANLALGKPEEALKAVVLKLPDGFMD